MSTTVIQLHELEQDAAGCLNRCLNENTALVVELPDHRKVRIEPYEEDDDLINNLIEHDEEFRALLARSLASGSRPFQPLFPTEEDEKESPQADE